MAPASKTKKRPAVTLKRKEKEDETTVNRKEKENATTANRKEKENAKESESNQEHTLTLNGPAPVRKRQRAAPLQPAKGIPMGIERKAKTFHKLKQEVLAPYFAQLFLERKFEDLLNDLDDAATLSETPSLANSHEEEDVFADANNTSHQDDWRQDSDGE